MNNNTPDTITIEEAASRLGCSKPSVYEGIRRGNIPGIKLGRRLVIPRAAFEAMLTQPAKPTIEPRLVAELMREQEIMRLLAERNAIDERLARLKKPSSLDKAVYPATFGGLEL